MVDPLIDAVFADVEVGLYAVIEERWVRLLVAELDLRLALGLEILQSDEIGLAFDTGPNLLSNIRARDFELLAETETQVAEAIPVLVQLALPSLLGSLPTFVLPPPGQLAGFELRAVGSRGVGGSGPDFEQAAVFFDLARPTPQPFERPAADTNSTGWRVVGDGSDRRLEIGLEPSAEGPYEAQYRIDGGLWNHFGRTPEQGLSIADPLLQVQGRHEIQVRVRWAGQPDTLDLTPLKLGVVIDDEDPVVRVRKVGVDRIEVDAFDVVSEDRLRYVLVHDGASTSVQPVQGRLTIPAEGAVSLVVIDEAGHRRETRIRTIRAAASAETPVSTCRCVGTDRSATFSSLWIFGLVGVARLARRSCALLRVDRT